MKLVIDANILISEAVRERGQKLLAHSSFRLLATERVQSEATYEIAKRLERMAQHGKIVPEAREGLLEEVLESIRSSVLFVPLEVYADTEEEARKRIPRDPDDWPTVALALVTEAAVWTNDNDFLGCGLPTWTTETLLLQLEP